MTPPSDRTVHARHKSGTEIVRYDRAGKWYIEHTAGSLIPAELVKVGVAAGTAAAWQRNGEGVVFSGRRGGGTFDWWVRQAQESYG